MKRKNPLRKAAAAALVLGLAVLCLPALAASGDGSCTLTIDYKDEETPIPGAVFRAYRAAEVTEHWEYVLTADFADSGVTLETGMKNSQWIQAAEDLAAWVEKKTVTPTVSGSTDGSGSLVFSGLEKGVYLVTGDPVTIEGTIYTPQTFCVVVPERGEGETLRYEVTAGPKFEKEVKTDAPLTGDDTHMGFWLALSGAALIGVAVAAGLLVRRGKRGRG